jgi:hypothetical protein
VARVGDAIDQPVHHLDHGVVQAQGGSGGECLGGQTAQPMVRIAFQTQQAVDHLVPQRTRSNALHKKIHAGRDLEPGVPQHRTDQMVGEHFGPVRTERDGAQLLGRLDAGINLRGGFVLLIGERWQISIENACGSGTDGHRSLLGVLRRHGVPGVGHTSNILVCHGRCAGLLIMIKDNRSPARLRSAVPLGQGSRTTFTQCMASVPDCQRRKVRGADLE